jgi:hypothetical protein
MPATGVRFLWPDHDNLAKLAGSLGQGSNSRSVDAVIIRDQKLHGQLDGKKTIDTANIQTAPRF